MNVIFTCGGTGGHINPAIAVANTWKERYPDSRILFIGSRGGLEEKLVPQAGYELVLLPGDGLSRRITLKAIKENIKVLIDLVSAVNKCKKIIREFDAKIVVGTGGYASCPALLAAAMLKIPTCVHESNAIPGLTTKLAEPWADRILICFPQSAQYYKNPEKVQMVGMPVRSEFIFTKKADARAELGFDDRPVILSAFGSMGAQAMNEMTAELVRLEKVAGYPYQHYHAVGRFGWRWMPDLLEFKGVEFNNGGAITMKEYVYNMPTVMAAADIVISRAGASSCNEIAAAGIPCILIPSPNVTANHQEKNARAMEAQGAAEVILENECTAEKVMEKIKQILENPQKYQKMRESLLSISIPDSAERICDIMEELTSGKTKR